MISSEVQRTLVKSPPELWAELGDPAALARHLGELGEIRITRAEPEKAVEWEAEDTTGTVLIKPSGWGTRVTLTVTREIAEPEPPAEPAPAASAPVIPEPEPEPVAPDGEPSELESAALADESDESSKPVREPRRGFFARLFRRRTREEIAEGPPAEPAPIELDALEIDAPEEAPDEDTSGGREDHTPDISAELLAAEEVAAEQVTAVLTGVLDRLGAAHHRPFSRS